ncbi:[FeFe] hydrogenase H-cluster radical SAM maturase HydG [uncultured Clostridium sp.]|uniref:[FeFe] hydrogenase H-cluster radical SAM maturase HydG n=1 Tax=uncultured Clostridium sp. TaxID=59620 RepID=UPI00261615DE|nr:[FeFe] hydrogenase H-cluster radical SAM maturase HydG [uncultured Clostridium sp.]
MFIKQELIKEILEETKNPSDIEARKVLDRVKKGERLSYNDAAILLATNNDEVVKEMYKLAGELKRSIYGKRIVMFAPLYVSDYCVNKCVYCGYKKCNKFTRRKLTQEEVAQEVRILEKMGHKRLALELGEDPVNAPIDYVLECLDTIYSTQNANGAIRRVNVNIAATTRENYKKLLDKGIGTYILFQETYDVEAYEKMHPKCLKGNYEYHLTSFDRAMKAGIEDVGGGALFGLADYRFEVLGLMMHNNYLEETYGVGFHTISVPRLRKASGVSMDNYPNLLTDEMFKRVVAVLRIAVPYVGLILSTRESPAMRKEVLRYGISQVSAGSSTGVGGYKEREETGKDDKQFETSDERSPLEVIKELLDDGYIPSYCTACYRTGRTGDRFMELAKTGEIQNVCEPNAITTLVEYALDYGDAEFKEKAMKTALKVTSEIKNEKTKRIVEKNIEKLKNGQRDLFL